MQGKTIQNNTKQYNAMQWQYNTMQYNAIRYNTMQYNIMYIQYYSILCITSLYWTQNTTSCKTSNDFNDQNFKMLQQKISTDHIMT